MDEAEKTDTDPQRRGAVFDPADECVRCRQLPRLGVDASRNENVNWCAACNWDFALDQAIGKWSDRDGRDHGTIPRARKVRLEGERDD